MWFSRVIVALSLPLILGLTAAADEPSPAEVEKFMDSLAKDPPKFLNFAEKAMKWEVPAEPGHIAGPIYFVGTKGLAVWLFKTSDGLIILDTGMPSSGPMIEESIKKLGFNPADIKLLLANHPHIDHVGAHAYLQKISGAKVAMIAESVAEMESGGAIDFFYGGVKEFLYEPVKVDHVFRDGDVIKLGDAALKAYLTEGHCKGATTFTTTITDNGQSYQVVIPDGAGANPGYRLRIRPSYPGLYKDYQRTFHILESIEPDIWLDLHNEKFRFSEKMKKSAEMGAEAWVDREGYRQYIIDARRKFEETIAKEME
jgi:metallo-beta-lactamase class B